ncbi:MAG: glycosyltransferase family 4 protein [Proteobacteria bacterium]|nr:glycosyltransferase family 4 protein [Pseudomonadota bacterium]MCP4921046.1 glycosyltransferase family 4 protein [Pseudomonadota bacterium]
MKILMVARRYPPDVRSGTETVFENLYRRARQKHEVRLVVGFRNDRKLVPPEAVAVDLRGVGTAAAWRKLWWAAVREGRRFSPDVVLANSIEVPTFGAPAACIVHDLNFGIASRSAGVRARELFYAAKSRRLGAVITVSGASRQRLVEVGVPEGKIHVVHNGVDLARFRVVPRRELPDEPEGMVRFAHPSRILPGKGQHVAIDAIARLPRTHKRRADLTVVGAVDDRVFFDQLKVQAWDQPVTVTGDVPEIAPYYQDADVVLFPTLMQEGFGFTAIEAMACGRPVIWSDQPAIREATGGIGRAVPQGDVVAMRAAMIELMDDPAERRRLGEAGRAFVEERYGWDGVWLRYERVLEGLRHG